MHLINNEDNPLKKIKTINDFCNAVGVTKGQLIYILYTLGVESRYKNFSIPKKSGGKREISSPTKGLRLVQYRLFLLLKENISFKSCVKGFVPGEGVVKNAMEHRKSSWVLNVDIEDFFGSINFGRVRGVFVAKPFEFSEELATLLARICILNNGLPQGAPTSPIISNIIASMLDNKILKAAKKYRFKYSRYADDITISSNRTLPKSIARLEKGETVLGGYFESLFAKSGFSLNYSKVRLQKRQVRQEVTGLVVNQKVNIPVEFKKSLRAAIHQWCNNPQEAERRYLVDILGEDGAEVTSDGGRLKRNIYGRLSFFSQVKGSDDSTYLNLVMKMAQADPNPPRFLKNVMERHHMYDVFICHASEDKVKIAHPFYDELVKHGMSVFIDDRKIKWGDSLVDVINTALHQAKVVVAIVSDNSIGKSWPKKEMNAVLASEISGKNELLILVDGDAEKLLETNMLVKDKLYRNWEDNADELALEIKDKLGL